MTDDHTILARLEVKLDAHVEGEEFLLKTIVEQTKETNDQLLGVHKMLATHAERSQSQHHRISKVESIILYGGGTFVTVFAGVVVAILTGAL